jgi:hypothetical protein
VVEAVVPAAAAAAKGASRGKPGNGGSASSAASSSAAQPPPPPRPPRTTAHSGLVDPSCGPALTEAVRAVYGGPAGAAPAFTARGSPVRIVTSGFVFSWWDSDGRATRYYPLLPRPELYYRLLYALDFDGIEFNFSGYATSFGPATFTSKMGWPRRGEWPPPAPGVARVLRLPPGCGVHGTLGAERGGGAAAAAAQAAELAAPPAGKRQRLLSDYGGGSSSASASSSSAAAAAPAAAHHPAEATFQASVKVPSLLTTSARHGGYEVQLRPGAVRLWRDFLGAVCAAAAAQPGGAPPIALVLFDCGVRCTLPAGADGRHRLRALVRAPPAYPSTAAQHGFRGSAGGGGRAVPPPPPLPSPDAVAATEAATLSAADGGSTLAGLVALREVLPADMRFAFEFRPGSWFNPDVYALLRACDWALVPAHVTNVNVDKGPRAPWLYDGTPVGASLWLPRDAPPQAWGRPASAAGATGVVGAQASAASASSSSSSSSSSFAAAAPVPPPIAASWGAYVRLHGSTGKFVGDYGAGFLRDVAAGVLRLQRGGGGTGGGGSAGGGTRQVWV